MTTRRGALLYERDENGAERYFRYTGRQWRACEPCGPKWFTGLIKAIKGL